MIEHKVLISQSMLFPWVGFLEQIKLCDTFIHYDDVQFSKGSFVNRVQLKTSRGMSWLTVPLKAFKFGSTIREIGVRPGGEWKSAHLDLLRSALGSAPHWGDVLEIVRQVYDSEHSSIGSLSRASLLALSSYFSIDLGVRYIDSATLGIPGSSSERVLNIVLAVGGNVYITGHGALNYLDHEMFETAGVEVRYVDYLFTAYPQLYGEFTPFVSSLDLIANCGREGAKYISSDTVNWRVFKMRKL